MLITAFCPHHHLEGLRRGAPKGKWEFSGCSRGMAPSSALPQAGDRQKQMNSAPPLQILFCAA